MLRDYRDIRQRLGDPLWWDDNGVPRYDAFAPGLCGVYDRYIAFNLVGCQGCDRQFKITAVITSIDMARDKVTLPTEHSVGSFHYGDPPAHGCVGDTMNSVPLRVLEFWQKADPDRFEWRRNTYHEVEFAQDGDGAW